MASAILPRTPAHGMTAACTRTTAPPRHAAAARPRSRASCVRVVHGGDGIAVKWVGPTRRSGFGRLRAEGPHSGSSKRGAMEVASSSSGSLGLEDPTPTEAAASSSSSDREAASEDGRAPAEPAADQAAPLLDRIASWATDLWVAAAVLPETYVVPAVGAIVSGAAVGGLPVAQPLAVLLLLVPCFCKKYSDWDASRVACNVELVSRHKRVSMPGLNGLLFRHVVSTYARSAEFIGRAAPKQRDSLQTSSCWKPHSPPRPPAP